MMADLNSFTGSAAEFFSGKFLPGLLSLDVTYIAMALAVFGVLLVFFLVLFKAGKWVVALVKKLLLLGIILASGYLVFTSFRDKLSVEAIQAAGLQEIALGVFGIIVLLFALAISLLGLGSHAKKRKESVPKAEPVPMEPTNVQQPKMLTTQALKSQFTSDRSLMAVISYVIIAEFGIFSSKTFPAPNPSVGMAFFAVFFFGAFIFIKTGYKNYARGVVHLIVATCFAVALSIFLGHLWGEIPLEVLLSEGYFGTNALVAVITGIAVSLLMGSRG